VGVGVVTVLPPGVVVVVGAVDVMLPVSAVALAGVVAPSAVSVAVVAVPLTALVAAPLGEIAAPHTAVVLGFVISTSVTTSSRPAGTVNAVTVGVPGCTVRAIATICSTDDVAVAASVDDDVVPAGVDPTALDPVGVDVVAMVGVVWAPATPAPTITRAAMSTLRVLRPIRDLP
jgi:hypothetical protein